MVISMKNKGYTVIELIVVIVIFGIITAVTLGLTSNAFKDNTDEYYKVKVKDIESNAKRYGMTLEEVKTEGSKVVTVKDLVDAGYLSPDNEEGDIIDPRNEKVTMNNTKVKITYTEEKGYEATLIEEE